MMGSNVRPHNVEGAYDASIPITRAISFDYVDLAAIRSNPNNAREHDRKQLAKLVRSIKKHGFLVPILIDEDGVLLCGHARVAAARILNIPEILKGPFLG